MAGDDRIQTKGRRENAAQPLDASDNEGGPERYPPARQDDAVEIARPRNPKPRQGAGDGSAPVADKR